MTFKNLSLAIVFGLAAFGFIAGARSVGAVLLITLEPAAWGKPVLLTLASLALMVLCQLVVGDRRSAGRGARKPR